MCRRPFSDVLCDCFEADCVFLDKVVIKPAVLDHQVKDAVEQSNVAARLDRQKEIAGSRDWCDARINDDDLCPVLASLPDVVRCNGRALRDVRPADPNNFRFQDVCPGIGSAVDSEGFLIGRRRAHHAEPAVVINICGLQAHAGKLAHQVRLLVRQTGAGEDRERIVAEGGLDSPNLGSHTIDSFIVTDRSESRLRVGVALISAQQAVRVRALEVALHTFRT